VRLTPTARQIPRRAIRRSTELKSQYYLCSTTGNLPMLSCFGKVQAIETDAHGREYATAKTGIMVLPEWLPHNLPFGLTAFDLVCLFDVLEHIQDDVNALRSIRSLLKSRGKLLLTVPAHQWLWSAHDHQLHHVRRYTASTLKRCFEAGGLRATKLTYFNACLFPLAAVARGLNKLYGRQSASGTAVPPAFLNDACQKI
jgi:SAM-dependent methyltransferase